MTITDERPTLTCNCRFNADTKMHGKMLSFEKSGLGRSSKDGG